MPLANAGDLLKLSARIVRRVERSAPMMRELTEADCDDEVVATLSRLDAISRVHRMLRAVEMLSRRAASRRLLDALRVRNLNR